MSKIWKTEGCDDSIAGKLAEECGVLLPTARILSTRGIKDRQAVERFLNPRLSDVADPFLLPDMGKAVEVVWAAVTDGKKITVFGDYDADGVTSSALLLSVLQKLGAKVLHFIPNRIDDGYGLSVKAVERCIELNKPDLLLTVDCGTNSQDAVELARKHGVDVVVTDHHAPAGPPCGASAVVNPELMDDGSYSELAGVGVAFKFCHAMLKRGIENKRVTRSALDLREYLDLVAIGTVADVVDLTGENRILVKHGIDRINSAPRPGVAAIVKLANQGRKVEAYHIGFVIGPRLNAAGRMDDAGPALDLLMASDGQKASELAGRLNEANSLRKSVEDDILNECDAEVGDMVARGGVAGIVVGREGWHAGTIGIVAARLCAKYSRPAVVVGFEENGMGKGSCRGVEKTDLMDLLKQCAAAMVSYGGHKMAAGLVIRRDMLDVFREKFNEACRQVLREEDMRPSLRVDTWIEMSEVSKALVSEISRLRPFGAGNPTPVFGAKSVRVVGNPRIVGTNHLKMVLAGGGTQVDAIAFGMGDREVPEAPIDVVFNLEENEYLGRTTVQMNVKDFRASNDL